MIIRRIKAERFGCLQDVEIEFDTGLNVIKGLNEAGKSTLHQALLMALFERPTRKQTNEAYRAWGADTLFRLEVQFEGPDSKEWTLCKDFEHNSTHLQRLGGELLDSWQEVQTTIASIIGTESVKVFLSTVCVAQDELTEISDGRKDISQGLEGIVTGDDKDVHTSAAIQKLDDAIRKYRRGYTTNAPKNPGPLAQLAEQQDRYRVLVDQLHPTIERQARDQQQRVEINERLQQIEQELEPKLAARAAADEAADLQARHAKDSEQEDELDATLGRIDEASQKRTAAAATLSELKAIAALDDDAVTALVKLNERISLLKEQRQALSSEPGAQLSARPSTFIRFVGPVSVAVLGVVAVAGGIIGGVAADSMPIAIAGGIVGFTGVLAAAIWAIAASRVGRAQPTAASQTFDEEKLTALSVDYERRLAETDCSDWVGFNIKRKRVEQARQDLRDAEVQLETLLPKDQTRSSLEAKRAQISRKRRDVEEKLAEPDFTRAVNMGSVTYHTLSRDITDLTGEQERLETELAVLEIRLSEQTASREDLLEAKEHLAQISERMEREKERLEVYELAHESLEAARELTLVRAQDKLGPRASKYFRALTMGRYANVDVDAHLNVAVAVAHNPGGPIDPSELSRGAEDQLYLALRLAIMDLLFPDTNPPLFLDDPFVKFDPLRQQAAFKLCQEIAQDRQVLLFTCSNDYDAASKLIVLEAV